jgi:hypothetical protein
MKEEMMRGDARQPQGDRRSIEQVADGTGLMFAAAMLFVVVAAIVAGLYIGVHVGK